ncbi:hypothetical protein F4678DRAFT_288055 [Xylaria arbuscula]|nr:hypothetical protein F4678DRAFT_288055 [Xylaria arbuscula]
MSSGRISTWTRFKLPSSRSLELSIFQPLGAFSNNQIHDAYYGSVAESNDEHIIVIVWESRQAYEDFQASAQHHELLTNLKEELSSAEPSTRIVDFDKIAFWWRFGPNTELRTVYFPASLPLEKREAVKSLTGLVSTMGVGIDGRTAHLSPYRGVPTCGWVEGLLTWENQDTVACLWCHYWRDHEAEEKFKIMETRPPKDGESNQLLAIEAFDKELETYGALGWDKTHVDFKKIPKFSLVKGAPNSHLRV